MAPVAMFISSQAVQKVGQVVMHYFAVDQAPPQDQDLCLASQQQPMVETAAMLRYEQEILHPLRQAPLRYLSAPVPMRTVPVLR